MVAYSAKLLTEAGVSVIVDATAGRRVWRQTARALIPCFAEIQLLCPTELCLERERAVRWGLTFETARLAVASWRPSVEPPYEESLQPELTLWTDECDVKSATARVLATIQRVARSPRGVADR